MAGFVGLHATASIANQKKPSPWLFSCRPVVASLQTHGAACQILTSQRSASKGLPLARSLHPSTRELVHSYGWKRKHMLHPTKAFPFVPFTQAWHPRLPSHQLTWVCAQTPVERLLSSWKKSFFALPCWLVGGYPPLQGKSPSPRSGNRPSPRWHPW